MAGKPLYFFIRANGETMHNDRERPECYIEGEPPHNDNTKIDYVDYCLREGIIRIGWPGTDRLHPSVDVPISTPCYGKIKPHIRGYLDAFRSIRVGDVVLMPRKRQPGVLFIGDVTGTYEYWYSPPEHPFECAHRLKVHWDRDADGTAVEYDARDLGLFRTWMWLRAFHQIDRLELIERITGIRHRNMAGAS